MQQCRKQIVAREGYLAYGELEMALMQRFGDQRGWSADLVEACNGMRRMLSSIEGAIDTALATHMVVTLRDVRQILMEQKELKKVGTFEALEIGGMVHSRKVRAFFLSSPATLERGEVPDVTTTEVLAAIAEEMNPGGRLFRVGKEDADPRDKQKQRQAVAEALDDLARRKGYERGTDLCVYIKGEPFVVWMLSQSRRHTERLEAAFNKHASSAYGRAVELHRAKTVESEAAAYQEVMEVAACREALQAAKWWRAVQRAVCGTGVEPAIRLVQRLLLSLPEVLARWDRIQAARRSLAGPIGDSDSDEKGKAKALVGEASIGCSESRRQETEGKEEVEEEEGGDQAASGLEEAGERHGAVAEPLGEDCAAALCDPVLGAWEEVVSRRLASSAEAGDGEGGVIRVADKASGSAAVLKAGDRVVLSAGALNPADWKAECDLLAARIKAEKDKAAKLRPRLTCLREALKLRQQAEAQSANHENPSGGLQPVTGVRQETGSPATKVDLPLRHGEVGTLVSVDASSVPYLVRTPSGSNWWYERKAIVAVTVTDSEKKAMPENCKFDAVDFTTAERDRLLQCLAPLVVFAMRKLPLECEAGQALISFDTQQAVTAVVSFLRSKTLKPRLDVIQDLLEAEEIFRGILSVNSSNVAPSLLHLLLEEEDLRGLLDTTSLPDATQRAAEAHESLGSEGVSESQVLDAVKGAICEEFAVEVSADDIIGHLARAEDQVCEVYGASSFVTLTSGIPFLRFCASWARQINPLLSFKARSRGRLGVASDEVRLRLLEVVHLSILPPDAERISP